MKLDKTLGVQVRKSWWSLAVMWRSERTVAVHFKNLSESVVVSWLSSSSSIPQSCINCELLFKLQGWICTKCNPPALPRIPYMLVSVCTYMRNITGFREGLELGSHSGDWCGPEPALFNFNFPVSKSTHTCPVFSRRNFSSPKENYLWW